MKFTTTGYLIKNNDKPSSKTSGSVDTPDNIKTPELTFYIKDKPEKTFNIGDSTNENTLDGKRLLQANLLLTGLGEFNIVDGRPPLLYYLITNVKVDNTATEDPEDRVYTVTVKKIMSKKNGDITLSVEEYKFTLKKVQQEHKEHKEYNVTDKNAYGITGHVTNSSGRESYSFIIESFTPIDVENIGNTYTNPITLYFKREK